MRKGEALKVGCGADKEEMVVLPRRGGLRLDRVFLQAHGGHGGARCGRQIRCRIGEKRCPRVVCRPKNQIPIDWLGRVGAAGS